jgi:hypothetical protein
MFIFILINRFNKDDLLLLLNTLAIPQVIITENRLRVLGLDALCIFLRRFAYPNRLFDLISIFGRPRDELSRIITYIMDHIFATFHHLLDSFDYERLTPEELQLFADAIFKKGAVLHDIWGFIDGTIRSITRPIRHQRQVYNGHKRVHAIKFQSVMTPDGIISHLTGPWIGRRHDSRMLRESGLMSDLEQFAKGIDGQIMHLYGDPAYPLTQYIISPFKGKIYF